MLTPVPDCGIISAKLASNDRILCALDELVSELWLCVGTTSCNSSTSNGGSSCLVVTVVLSLLLS